VNRADEKTGDARMGERHFSRSGEQCAVAEASQRDQQQARRSREQAHSAPRRRKSRRKSRSHDTHPLTRAKRGMPAFRRTNSFHRETGAAGLPVCFKFNKREHLL